MLTGSDMLLPKARIRLEGWGLPASEVLGLAERLNACLPQIEWCVQPEAVTLMLVDIAALAGEGGRAVWNTYGPVEAMRLARQAGRCTLALCRGRISDLPASRDGVWIASAEGEWDTLVQVLARALAALEWTPCEGYREMYRWRAVSRLARANLLATLVSDGERMDYAALLRRVMAASLMAPAVLLAAGVDRVVFGRILREAGLQDVDHAVAPMTLDGVARVDGLVGYDWPAPLSSVQKPARE